jgi:HEAT repeat protein
MASGGLVPWLLRVEAALVVLCVVGLLAATAVRLGRLRRLRPRVLAARAAVAQMLDAGDGAEPVGALPRRARVALLATVGASVRGAGGRLSTTVDRAGFIATAAARCSSPFWWRRLRGVRTLAIVGAGDDVVPPRLCDPHPEVRAAAAQWAVEHGTPDVARRLLEMLDDEAPLVRFAAADSLLRMGGTIVDALAAYLASATSARAVEGALTVAAGSADPRLLEPALGHGRDGSPRARELAAAIGGRIGGAAAIHALLRLLDDPEPQVRAAAAESLGRLRHWPAATRLARSLRDPAWVVRQRAGLALKAIGAPGIITLRQALEDPDPFARDMARQVLDLPGSALRVAQA